ncbi:MAG: ABC transporter ATP-binding protein [bacterium]
MEILALHKAGFSYGQEVFIADLSLSVENREFIGLIGANGSGKSTILKLAAGILKQDAGEINLWGKPIRSLRGKDRAKLISYLPQMLDMNVPFTVKELVSMGLYPYEIPPALSADEAVAVAGLREKMNSPVTELSGGERRRVFIAMTLVQGAGILLLDEPLANLDIKYQVELVRLLKQLRDEEDMSIVMALHDINLAFQFDRVYVVKQGRVIAAGDPFELITDELLKDAFNIDVKVYHHGKDHVSFGYD